MLDLNVRGVFLTTQAALKHLKDGGRVIMIGSCVGERMMTPGLAAYSATKGAVKMFTQGLSREVGKPGHHGKQRSAGSDRHGFESSIGRLGGAQKAMTPLNRYGTVDEVSSLVAFLAGPESSYITGANLTVDGGTNA